MKIEHRNTYRTDKRLYLSDTSQTDTHTYIDIQLHTHRVLEFNVKSIVAVSVHTTDCYYLS